MAAAAVVEFQRAQSLISTDRNASIDIFHSIGGFYSAISGGQYLSNFFLNIFLSLFGAGLNRCRADSLC